MCFKLDQKVRKSERAKYWYHNLILRKSFQILATSIFQMILQTCEMSISHDNEYFFRKITKNAWRLSLRP